MSTRSSIYWTNNGTHVYEETLEYTDDGFNIYYTAFWKEYRHLKISKTHLFLEWLDGRSISLSLIDIFDVEIDEEGFAFGINPKTTSSNIIEQMKNS